MGLFFARLFRTRIYHRERKFFVLLGHDLYDSRWGITFGYGYRPDATEGETAWRQVWRIAFAPPISIRHRHGAPKVRHFIAAPR